VAWGVPKDVEMLTVFLGLIGVVAGVAWLLTLYVGDIAIYPLPSWNRL
jgi:hypothetical protein